MNEVQSEDRNGGKRERDAWREREIQKREKGGNVRVKGEEGEREMAGILAFSCTWCGLAWHGVA